MNILHVTCLSNNRASGIAGIVPSHIHWQSKYARILWLNISSDYNPPKDLNLTYHCLEKRWNIDISLLPKPFNKPDIVVFHGIYFYKYCLMAGQLNKIKVPYIVVPHGSLTCSSIRKKFVKKHIAFVLLFRRFLRKARAIQYLVSSIGRKMEQNPYYRSKWLSNAA